MPTRTHKTNLTHYAQTDTIINSLINGQYKQAKSLTQKGCRTLPEKQARLVGRVIFDLTHPEGSHNDPDLALIYLNLFGH